MKRRVHTNLSFGYWHAIVSILATSTFFVVASGADPDYFYGSHPWIRAGAFSIGSVLLSRCMLEYTFQEVRSAPLLRIADFFNGLPASMRSGIQTLVFILLTGASYAVLLGVLSDATPRDFMLAGLFLGAADSGIEMVTRLCYGHRCD